MYRVILDYKLVYPLDVVMLVNKMEIELVEYGEFSREQQKLLMRASNDGFSFLKNSHLYIYYNQRNLYVRIKFTIAHEIGHASLGHLYKLEKNNADEEEANYFAQVLLAPVCVALELRLDSAEDIQNYFDISRECAKIVHENLKKELKEVVMKKQMKKMNS